MTRRIKEQAGAQSGRKSEEVLENQTMPTVTQKKKVGGTPKSLFGKVSKIWDKKAKHNKIPSPAHQGDRPTPQKDESFLTMKTQPPRKIKETVKEEDPFALVLAEFPRDGDSGLRDEGERFASVHSDVASFGLGSLEDGRNNGSMSSLEF